LSEIADRLERRCASFEASLGEAPQDEEFLHAIKDIPHAEERPEGASRSTHDLAEVDLFASTVFLIAAFAGMMGGA
jgi:hypothetical protein